MWTFLKLYSKVEKYLWFRLVCLPVCTLSNSRKYSSNALILILTSDIAWIVLKMVRIRLIVRLQRHTKVLWYIKAYGRKCLKCILKDIHCNKCNIINIRHSNMQKYVFYEKWYKKYKHFIRRLLQNFSHTLHPIGENF